MEDIETEIHHLSDTMSNNLQHPKILQTQVPLFRGNHEKYNEFEHLLLNHLRPHQQKLSEEQKLTFFQSLLRDDAIEFWQSLKKRLKQHSPKYYVISRRSMPKRT